MANDASVWLKPRYRKHNYFFVWPFLTETKFKMAAIAAILDKIRRPFCIGFFSSMVQIHPMSFKWIGASVLLLLSGNQMQDGCHGHVLSCGLASPHTDILSASSTDRGLMP